MNLRVDRVGSCGAATARNPVLYLRPAKRGGPLEHLAEHMVRHSVHCIIEQPVSGHPKESGSRTDTIGLGAWRALEAQFTSSSLGVIAEGREGIDAVLQLLLDGEAGGEVPGAMVLFGFDGRLPEVCLRLAAELSCSPQDPQGPETLAQRAGRPVPFEWPPMVMFLPAVDPNLAACGRACREMRSAGVPIRLEVMDASLGLAWSGATLAGVADVASEIDDHLSTHLAPVFPALL